MDTNPFAVKHFIVWPLKTNKRMIVVPSKLHIGTCEGVYCGVKPHPLFTVTTMVDRAGQTLSPQSCSQVYLETDVCKQCLQAHNKGRRDV